MLDPSNLLNSVSLDLRADRRESKNGQLITGCKHLSASEEHFVQYETLVQVGVKLLAVGVEDIHSKEISVMK